MTRTSIVAFSGLCALALSTAALGQGQQVYRYNDPDGRVVYSDRPPPGDAKNVTPKRLRANFIENNELPIAAQQAMERFPVTLYTFDCGEVCNNAESLLNKRGVPYSTVLVSDLQGASKLQALTGEAPAAPVLQVGDKLIAKGFSETRWQAMLDEAGYPKTPPPRRVAPGKQANEPPKADPNAAPVAVTPPVKGTDYPK
jgi:glutaredoxin